MVLGEHFGGFFYSQLLKIEAAWLFGCWPGKKQVLYRHAWSFKPKNHSKSFLGAYECKLQSRFCPLGHSSAVVAVVFVVIEKTGSPVFFLSFLH